MRKILLVGNFLSQHIGTKANSEVLADKLRVRGWEVITTSSFLPAGLRLSDMLVTAWRRRNNYDVAHVDVFSGRAFLWAEAVSDLLYRIGKPFILTFHSLSILEFAQRWPERVRRLMSKGNKVMTPSLFLQRKLACFRDDIEYVPIGVDLSDFGFQLRAYPEPNLCWLRAFHEMYNPILAIETLALLRDVFPGIHLTMYGPDERDGSFAKVHASIEESGLKDNVHIVGPVPHRMVPVLLQKHKIYLNTTNYESFGIAVMEAGATGLPIITTNVGELPLLWTNEQDALLVPADDPEAMANAVRRILTEPGLAERLSRNARKNAEQFDWSVVFPRWEELFRKVMEMS